MANRTSCKTIQLCLNSNVYTALNNYYKDDYGTLESYLLAHLETVYNRRVRKDLRDFIAAANDGEPLWPAPKASQQRSLDNPGDNDMSED